MQRSHPSVQLVDRGAALRRSGRRRAARDTLRRALDLAEASGDEEMVRRTLLELAAAGARRARRSGTGPRSLTPSERRVSGLAAQGFTNREIAEALFVTRKTVETHLANAYRKLAITSRRELPSALQPT